MIKILFYIIILILTISNCFCGELDEKFEHIFSKQRIQRIYKNFSSDYFSDSRIEELKTVRILYSKKIKLANTDKNFYYISWIAPSESNVIYCNLYEFSFDELFEDDSVWISRIKSDNSKENNPFDMMDYKFSNFLHKSNFFENYFNSTFSLQCESYRLENTISYLIDLDNDGNEEIFSFVPIAASDIYTSAIIYKYINEEWKKIFDYSFFGWEEFWSHEHYTQEEWYNEKNFPYDFVEYKGKIGLRIICYNDPKYRPSQYRAQFWAYDENTKQYEMLEEVWNTEEDTPPDGLIFAKARADLFTNNESDFSKLDSKLTAEDLQDLDKAQLRLMRNAVYARHGRTFKSVDLQSLWNCYTWYKVNPNYSDELLTDIDKYNIKLIQQHEAQR